MNIHRINSWVKKAINRQLGGGLEQGEPYINESLSNEYGMNAASRAASAAYINEDFKNKDDPIVPPLLAHETRNTDTVKEISAIIRARFNVCLALCFLTIFSHSEPAYAITHIQDIDRDGDEEIVSYQELRIFLIYQRRLGIAEFDLRGNQNGKLDGAEIDEYNKALELSIEQELGDHFYDEQRDILVTDGGLVNGQKITLNRVLDSLDSARKITPDPLTPQEQADQEEERRKAEESDFTTINQNFFIRRSGSDVSIREGALVSASAELSYTNDNENDFDVGRITGAFGFLSRERLKVDHSNTNGLPQLDEYTFGGSIEIDQTFDSRGDDFEADSLIFRLGGDLEFSGSTDNFPVQYFSTYLKFQTDSDFETSALGVESIYEPYFNGLDRVVPFRNGNLRQRIIPTLRSEYSNISDDPNNQFTVDEFWNLGFGLSYGVSYAENSNRVASFVSTYEHFWDTLGSGSESYNWINELQIPLAERNGLAIDLTGNYTLAKNEIEGTETDLFSLGIGVRY